MSNAVVKVLSNPEAQKAFEEQQQLEAQIKALKEQRKALKEQTKGMSLTLFENTAKDGSRRCAVVINGVSMRSHSFYAEQATRLFGDTPEAVANRKAIMEYIEVNKEKLTWKK